MQPGEAIYLGPNEPHAYLSGGKFIKIHMYNVPCYKFEKYVYRLHRMYGMF